MNKKQYNNVIDYTVTHEASAQTDDSLATVRAIFNNMGVALPQGDMKTVYETIKTDDYMGWRSCTMQEAQAAADKGTAAIGISEDKIVILSANDEEQPVAQTASVISLDENTSAFAVDGLEYYSYSYGTTTSTNSRELYMPVNLNQKWSGHDDATKRSGCAICCAVDVASYYDPNKNYTVQDLINFGAASKSGISNWGKVPKVQFTDYYNGNFLEKIKSEIDNDHPVLVHMKNNANTSQHWVVAYKYINNAATNNDIYVLDPAGNSVSAPPTGEIRTITESMQYNGNHYIYRLKPTTAK